MTTTDRPVPTTDEIVAFLHQLVEDGDDLFGFVRQDLVIWLPWDKAKAFLDTSKIDEENWNIRREKGDFVQLTREKAVKLIAEYMPFAWEKANACRGLSAMRTLEHMIGWLFLAGEKELCDWLRNNAYDYYGKAELIRICIHFGIDWRSLDNDKWSTDEIHSITRKEALKKLAAAGKTWAHNLDEVN